MRARRTDVIPRTPAGPSVTIAIPLDALGPVTVTAPPPALVSSDVGAEYVGCTRAALVEHLSWMARSPRWRDRVIVASRKRRLAAPADVVASMRDRYAPTSTAAPAADDDAALDAALDRDLGIIDAPPVGGDGIDHDLLRRAGRRMKPTAGRAKR